MSKAIICGAGIAGLTAASYLKQIGYQVTVFEKFGELRTAGVGLNIWPNGVRAIRGIGLGDAYQQLSSVTYACQSMDATGLVTSEDDVRGWEVEHGGPLTGAHRRSLTELLASALTADELRFGHEACSYEQDDNRVTVRFSDGSQASADIVVGADGVGSNIRNHLVGHEPEFTGGDIVRWRGVFRCDDAGVEPNVQVDVIGSTGHFGWIPIGRGLAYWFCSADGRHTLESVLEYFTPWTQTPVPTVIAATPKETIIDHRLMEYREHLSTWIDGRVVLIGDAAHPMMPGMAQGANQALEDCASLARYLRDGESVPAALVAFEAERLPWAHRMVEYSRKLFDFEESNDAYGSSRSNLLLRRYEEFEHLRARALSG